MLTSVTYVRSGFTEIVEVANITNAGGVKRVAT